MLEQYNEYTEGYADERLAIPVGILIQTCRDTKECTDEIYKEKAEYIKEISPSLVRTLLCIDDEIRSLDITESIREKGELPSQRHLEIFDTLNTVKLGAMTKFVKSNFSSVEDFIEWWENKYI